MDYPDDTPLKELEQLFEMTRESLDAAQHNLNELRNQLDEVLSENPKVVRVYRHQHHVDPSSAPEARDRALDGMEAVRNEELGHARFDRSPHAVVVTWRGQWQPGTEAGCQAWLARQVNRSVLDFLFSGLSDEAIVRLVRHFVPEPEEDSRSAQIEG